MAVQQVTILGATGSIGVSTLDVIERHPERFQVFAVTAQRRVDALLAQVLAHRPRYAVVMDEPQAESLQASIRAGGLETEVLVGVEGLRFVASHSDVDIVMAAIIGAAGLLPTLAAAEAGKRVLLANKEALVMSGDLFMQAVRDGGATLLPIDSEHNAVFQCLPQPGQEDAEAGVERIILTASGGPFRDTPVVELAQVTPDQACAHPNWSMGRKISVDSATMMNKGLELIEACWLFDVAADRVDTVIHRQSIVHSMVSYSDGSVLAQMGNPDMRTPIAYGLAWPDRLDSGVAALDLVSIGQLDFASVDEVKFPCVALARQAIDAGGTAPAILNAANEIAVAAFLEGRLPYLAIPQVIAGVMEQSAIVAASTLEMVLQADAEARTRAESLITHSSVDVSV